MSSEASTITTELPTTTTTTATATAAAGSLNFNDTELTLGLPGESRGRNLGTKRRFSDTIDLKLGADHHRSDEKCSKSPPSMEQVVGWPPVRSYRKNMTKIDCKYVKVAVDGAPYLRKVDLELFTGYEQLLCAFEGLFSCQFAIKNVLKRKLMDPVNGLEYVPTYEDKEGDWMLVGDVPWKMFVESCKRIRLMKSSEAMK